MNRPTEFDPLWTKSFFFFFVVFRDIPKIDSFRLPTHSRNAYTNFLMISYFKIEIFVRRDEFVTLGHKGLNRIYA